MHQALSLLCGGEYADILNSLNVGQRSIENTQRIKLDIHVVTVQFTKMLIMLRYVEST